MWRETDARQNAQQAAQDAIRHLQDIRTQGLIPNITAYNNAIVASWRADRSDTCLALYRDLVKEGVNPNK